MLPFFAFSSIAGELCDKYSKSTLIQWVKLSELAILAFGCAALYAQNIAGMLTCVFLMGVRSTFISPTKLSLLPEYLCSNTLIRANAYIETGTFFAILAGEIFARVVRIPTLGHAIFYSCVLTLSVGGFVASLYLPKSTAKNPALKVNYNPFTGIMHIIKHTRYSRTVYLSILGISWFWLVAGMVLSEIPILIKEVLHAPENALTLSLVVFSLGIAAGSNYCNYLLKDRIEATYVPIAAFCIAFVLYDLASIIHSVDPAQQTMTLYAFLSSWSCFRITADFFVIGFLGGVYHVPLYALMQHESSSKERARVVACQNILSSAFMIAGSVLNLVLKQFFLCNAASTLAFVSIMFAWLSFYISQVMPSGILRALLRFSFTTIYRTRIHGMDNYNAVRSKKLIILANHTSWVDAIMLAAFFPDKLTFALNHTMADHWMVRFFVKLNKVYFVDPTQPLSLRGLIEAVKDGEKVVCFPEGRLTVTGALMKFTEDPVLVALKSSAMLLPVHINGMQHSIFSRFRFKSFQLWPQTYINIAPAQSLELPENIDNRSKRKLAGAFLYRLMTDITFEASRHSGTLLEALALSSQQHGRQHTIAEDMHRQPISYRQLFFQSFALSLAIQEHIDHENSNIGILLPTFIPTLSSFMGLQALGKIPVMLNFTFGPSMVIDCCSTAQVRTVITSHAFIQLASLEPLQKALADAGIQLLYLEDMKKAISPIQAAHAFLGSWLPTSYLAFACPKTAATHPAVILFTSGSEGKAKGVALSHQNILANIAQFTSVLDLNRDDKVFNTLPLFHSFGLIGALLPILSGFRVFLYPRALHYRVISELIYNTDATILFGTDYLLNLYANHANSYDYYSLRYVFSGAEKLQKSTAQLWADKFGIRILEGYGLTEAAPGVSFNTPMHYKAGSVGRFLPKMQTRLQPVAGVKQGGQLYLKGPNIMLGYLLHSAPGIIQPPLDGWHDTGDIVNVDAEGFCHVLGRTKRFAKIAGEMISLTAIEQALHESFPEHHHAVVAKPCPKRGESIVVCTEHPDLSRSTVKQAFTQQQISELWQPKIVINMEIPRFATGKTNYVELQAVLQQSPAENTAKTVASTATTEPA